MRNSQKPFQRQEVLCEINTNNRLTPHSQMVSKIARAGGDTRNLEGSHGQYTCRLTRAQVRRLGIHESQIKITDID